MMTIHEREHSRNFQPLLDATGLVAIYLDRDSRVVLYSAAAQELLGLGTADCGRSVGDVAHELLCQGDQLQSDVLRVLEGLPRVEREVATRGGGCYLLRVLPCRASGDSVSGVVLTLADLSDRKRLEARLRQNETQLQHLLRSITDHAIITVDGAGTINGWNAGAERIFGYSTSEALGQSIAIIFTPEDRASGAHEHEMQTARREGRAADERWHLRKDGSRFFVSGVLTRLDSDGDDGFVKVATDLTEHRRQEEALRRAHDELEVRVAERTRDLAAANEALQNELRERREAEERVRKLLSQLITVQEDERRRIARDLHDDLGQKMTALHLKLEALRRAHQGSPLQAQVEEAQAFVQKLDRDLDFFTWELRPAALYDLGLVPALRDFVAQWSNTYGISAAFDAVGIGGERLRSELEINMYRIAQEALNNVYKHARAQHVDVVLLRRDAQIVLSVEDDGAGFDASAVDVHSRGIGLIGMRERAALMGGQLDIERSERGGTTVIVTAPAELRRSFGTPTGGSPHRF